MQDPRANYANFSFHAPNFKPELAGQWAAELEALPEFAGITFHFGYAEKSQLQQHRSALSANQLLSMQLFLRPAVAGFVRMARQDH